jgi:hypothetical protein
MERSTVASLIPRFAFSHSLANSGHMLSQLSFIFCGIVRSTSKILRIKNLCVTIFNNFFYDIPHSMQSTYHRNTLKKIDIDK